MWVIQQLKKQNVKDMSAVYSYVGCSSKEELRRRIRNLAVNFTRYERITKYKKSLEQAPTVVQSSLHLILDYFFKTETIIPY